MTQIYCIADHIRNIHFPFDIEMDTALSVATEMVAELDMTDQDVTRIADMIDGEISSLVPEWRPGLGIVETPRFVPQDFCHNCASNHTSTGSFMEFMPLNSGSKNSQPQCCEHGCASMHGRFEEIMFKSEEYDNHIRDDDPNVSSRSECLQYHELWKQHESCEITPVESERSHSDEQNEQLDKPEAAEDKRQDVWENRRAPKVRNCIGNLSRYNYWSTIQSVYCDLEDNYGKEIQQELRWLRAKYQMGLREVRDRQFGLRAKSSHGSNIKHNADYGLMSLSSSLINRSCPNSDTQRARTREAMDFPGKVMASAKSLCTGSLLPHSLHRTLSLPVDAVDI